MDDWTRRLARAYAACRATYPEDTTVVVVGVEGVLLDEGGEPQPGVPDLVRLFQLQPLTQVALVDHRPGDRTALDALARAHDLDLAPALELGDDLRRDGHRIAAAIVRDPASLGDDVRRDGHRTAAAIVPDRASPGDGGPTDALVVDAATVLASRRRLRPGTYRGPVELVWHRVNQPVVFRQFLASPIRWAEVDVRRDDRGRLVVHHGDIDQADGELTTAGEVFAAFREAGKGVNLDVKDPGALAPTLDAVADHGFPDEDVWVNGRIDQLSEAGLRSVKARFPGARLQCPLEFLGPVAATMPDVARGIVARIQDWGVDRFSLGWTHPDMPVIRDRLDEWGIDANLYAVTDLEQCLAALLAVPRSLTADFALPEWHYFGRGMGNDGEFHRDPGEATADPPGIDVA